MHLYIGNWVVDDLGDYCQITRIVEDTEIWGEWSGHEGRELCTHIEEIIGKYPTKKQAKAVADIIKQQSEELI